MYLDLHKMIIEVEMDLLFEYLSNIDFSVTNYQKRMSSFRQEDHNFNYNLWKAYDMMPRIMYNSFIMALFSFIEKNLYDFCVFVAMEYNIKKEIDCQSDDGIKKYYNYINRILEIEFNHNYWMELSFIKEIRNSIAHRDGEVKDERNYKNYLIKNKIIEGKGDSQLILNSHFCHYTLMFTKKIFDDLYLKIEKREFNE